MYVLILCVIVGLGSEVYIWSMVTGKATKLCEFVPPDMVTSVSWTCKGNHLAVGTRDGIIEVWDTMQCKKIRTLTGHSSRVAALAWNTNLLASGSLDKKIVLRDARVREPVITTLVGHREEVCGLKWSPDESKLASGGNDDTVLLWNISRSDAPLATFKSHTAAVKALAWSPHQNGLLASGGGKADRCIRFWNTLSCTEISAIDTGSQVCNLGWSASVNEIVSTHAHPHHQIIVWKYPTMRPLTSFAGPAMKRALYFSMSPTAQTIVTGGDEMLQFWNVFPAPAVTSFSSSSSSSLSSPGSSTSSHSTSSSSYHTTIRTLASINCIVR